MMNVKEMTLLALLTSILFVQEQILSFLPNIQLSVFLVVLYTRLLTFKQVSYVIFIHVFLDNLVMGGLTLTYTPAMFVAWMLVPIILKTVLRRFQTAFSLAAFGFVFGIIYGLTIAVNTIIVTGTPAIPYIISDLPYEGIMATANFITILWLYDPLYKFLDSKLTSYGIRN